MSTSTKESGRIPASTENVPKDCTTNGTNPITPGDVPIQMLWIGPRLSKLQHVCIESCVAQGHPVHLYTYTDVRNVPDGVTIKDANTILPESDIFTYPAHVGSGNSYAAFANLFRYALLFELGGWWLDTDVYLIRPLLHEAPYVFVREPGSREIVHNGVLRVPAKSTIMHRMFVEARSIRRTDLTWGRTGGMLLTTVLHHEPHLMRFVLPSTAFCPIHWNRVVRAIVDGGPLVLKPDTCGVHLFNEMWQRKGLDADADWPIYHTLARALRSQHEHEEQAFETYHLRSTTRS